MRIIRLGFASFVFAVALLSDVVAGAQQQALPVVSAPVPPAIYSAKKVFISNAGADRGLFPEPFSGEPERAYNEFYADVQGLGRDPRKRTLKTLT